MTRKQPARKTASQPSLLDAVSHGAGRRQRTDSIHERLRHRWPELYDELCRLRVQFHAEPGRWSCRWLHQHVILHIKNHYDPNFRWGLTAFYLWLSRSAIEQPE